MSSHKPSADAFLSTVKKSGLVEAERLQKALADFEAAGGDADDSLAIAEFLIDGNVLSQWQAEKLLQGKHKGYFLGKYRLISLLGKGGMSSVFLAEHILMRRRCAIKVLPTKRVTDSSYLARFHREAQAVAALDHPNIVRAYDVDHQVERDAEIHFLVMEYVEGSSLQELVANDGPSRFEDAVDYIRQAALGLEHAHQAGMVHRDIKPGNLLVDPNGTVKLLDLGLARYFSSEEEGTALTIAHDEKVLGTADYLAPEQALDSHTVDHRADIYSLGCTLYFLLTGHPPFTEGTLAQRLMAHQTKEPPPVENDRPDTPASLSAILRKMMAKKADDRYATAQEVADVALVWLAENAAPSWKQSRSTLFGGLRGSDTNLGQDTVAEPAKAIPVAKPVVLKMTTQQEEPKTTIVARAPWPTGDLTPSSSEPELSSFLAQLDVEPTGQDSSPKPMTSPKPQATKGKSGPIPAVKPSVASPTTTVLNFDFLSGGPAAQSSAPPVATSVVVGQSKPASSKTSATPPPAKPAAPQAAAPIAAPPVMPASIVTPPQPTSPASESAFPHFDFAAPAAPVPVVTEPPPKPAAPLSSVGQQVFTTIGSLTVGSLRLPPRNVLIAAGALGFVLVGALGAYLFGWFDSGTGSHRPDKQQQTSKKAEIWAKPVITVYGEDADYHSLQDALTDAPKFFRPQPAGADGKPDRRSIQVAAGTYEESVHIDGSKSQTNWPEGIVVRGEGEVVFKPKEDGPVLSLKEVTGLSLENLTIDAGQQPVGVRVTGYVTGCRLSRIKIHGFTDAGLVLHGVQAFGDPFLAEKVQCDSKSASAVGIRVEPMAAGTAGDDSNNVNFIGCRLNGPLAAGVTIKGTLPYKIVVRESVFVKTAVGIRLEGAGRWMDFAIANNSFFQCPIGIAFTTMPDPVTGGLMIRRNLFVGTSTAEAMVQAGYNPATFTAMLSDPAGMEWNWSDRTAPATPPPGEINLFAANGKRGDAAFAFASQSPNDAKFLAPTEASQQKSAPNPRENEKPWIGAVGP